MRSTLLAFSSLAMLLAWEVQSPAQATTDLASPESPATIESIAQAPKTTIEPVSIAPPETIVPVESLSNNRSFPKQEPLSSDIQLSSSDNQRSKSEVQARMSNIQPQMSEVQARTVEIQAPSSNIQPRMSEVQPRSSNIQVSSSNIQPRSSNVQASNLNIQPSGSKGNAPSITVQPAATGVEVSSPTLAQTPTNPDPTASPVDRLPQDADVQPLDPEDTKSELGEIEIITPAPQQTPQRRQPDVQLLLRSSVFSSSNVTALDILRRSDTVFVNSAQLLATPKLGDSTRLIASAGGGFARFGNEGESNYNFVNYNVAIQQRLAPGTYGQLGWVQDTLYRNDDGKRLVQDNGIQFILGRQDQLGRQLRLDSFYELRAGFADPNDQSRVTNTLGTRLRYDITPQLQGALDYRLTFRNYTQIDRSDTEHQVSALAIYNISPDVFVAGSVSYLFGRSSDAAIDLDNLSFGINLGFNVPF